MLEPTELASHASYKRRNYRLGPVAWGWVAQSARL